MPTIHSHTHCQVAQADTQAKTWQRVCLSNRTDEKRKSTIAQHCIKAIAGDVVKSRSVHIINFCGSGKVRASKSATALIRDRWRSCKESNLQ